MNGEEVEIKKRPKHKEWISLGQNYGIDLAVWDKFVTICKRQKVNGEWQDKERFLLSKRVLTELFVRIPIWYSSIAQEEAKK